MTTDHSLDLSVDFTKSGKPETRRKTLEARERPTTTTLNIKRLVYCQCVVLPMPIVQRFEHWPFVREQLFLSDEGSMLETLDYTIRIGSTPTFLYFYLYLYSAYAAHYVYYNNSILILHEF